MSGAQKLESACFVVQIPRVTLRVSEAAVSLGVSVDWLEQHVLPYVAMVRRGRMKLVCLRVAELGRAEQRAAVRRSRVMTARGPLTVVWDALAAHGCQPRGELWKFIATCPAHEDRSPSLSVAEGCDRRVLVHCNAGCRPEAVVAAIGLQMAELFPVGHRKARRPGVAVPADTGPAEALVDALNTIGTAWSGLISSPCPYCDHPAAWWQINPERVDLTCPEGCVRSEIIAALEGRVAIAKGSHEPR